MVPEERALASKLNAIRSIGDRLDFAGSSVSSVSFWNDGPQSHWIPTEIQIHIETDNARWAKGRQGEIRGGKTSGRRTHPSNTGTQAHMWGDKGRQGETRGDKGRQGETRPRVGGHTIQHQGGHLKKALRNPNSTLLGENQEDHFPARWKVLPWASPRPYPWRQSTKPRGETFAFTGCITDTGNGQKCVTASRLRLRESKRDP